jgi:type-F conjugative transfer system pilin chaperone TraQ
MRKFRLPELDVTGMWVVAVGVWFHIFARLVSKQPDMAIQLGEVVGVVMVIVGGYKILNRLLAEIDKEECAKDETQSHD